MNEQPHTVAIGAFIVGALLIAITGLIFLGSSGFGSDKNKVVMVFDGSVKGLSVGAPVALRGVQIGQITDISLIFDTDTVDVIMQVEAELDNNNIRTRGSTRADHYTDELIARGMRAQLNTQSLLTGLLYIQLDFFPDSPVVLADIQTDYTQVPTIPTELERLTREIESIDWAQLVNDLRDIASGLNSFIGSDKFQSLPGEMQASLNSFTALGDEMKQLLSTSGPKLDQVLDNTATAVASVNTELPIWSGMAKNNLRLLESALLSMDEVLNEVDALVSEDSATTYQLNKALRELAQAGRALQLLAKTLEEQPEILIRGKSEEKQ
ncbi:MAG: paraquat-inducible protein B [Alcanivorax sp.]|jgi:paraquat-inducible protein B